MESVMLWATLHNKDEDIVATTEITNAQVIRFVYEGEGSCTVHHLKLWLDEACRQLGACMELEGTAQVETGDSVVIPFPEDVLALGRAIHALEFGLPFDNKSPLSN